MTKTQVQIPDELYRTAKAIAKAREWSLAEVMRRGLEYMAQTHPVDMLESEWNLPVIRGGDPLDMERFNERVVRDQDEWLMDRAGANR